MKIYYPEVRIVTDANINNESCVVILSTTLRKKHRGKYYLWNFEKQWAERNLTYSRMSEIVNLFHKEVYLAIVLGKINTNMLSAVNRESMFKVDDNQESEEHRLIRPFLTFKKKP